MHEFVAVNNFLKIDKNGTQCYIRSVKNFKEDTMSDLVPASPKPLFKKQHELAKMVKQLNKISKKAVEVLEAGLTSEDERVRMIAAEKLLKFYMDSAEAQRADEIKSLLLDIKLSGMIGNGSTADDDNTPALDFDNISPEFADAQNVVDLGTVNKI